MSNADQGRAEAATLPEGDVTAVLLTQHARIRDLFSDVKGAGGEQKQRKFDELRELLAVHETAEEVILRPVARKAAGEEEVKARNHEEEEASKVLSELEKLVVDSAEFDAMFAAFEQSVSDHAEHEEREEFPAVRRACSQEELTKMGKRLLAVEKTAPTHPHPSTTGSPVAQGVVGPFASMVDRARDAINSTRDK